jgi:hypothetical protein
LALSLLPKSKRFFDGIPFVLEAPGLDGPSNEGLLIHGELDFHDS